MNPSGRACLSLLALALCAAGTVAGSTSVGSCGIDAAPGFRYQGVVWPRFGPEANAGYAQYDPISNRLLGPQNFTQGANTSSAAECNCMCANVDTCVGYTWLGGNLTQCWLHSYVSFYVNPVSTYISPDGGAIMPVPADTVLGRVIRNASWPLCNSTWVWQGKMPASMMTSNSVMDSFPLPLDNFISQCNQACGNNPMCISYTWINDTTGNSSTANCTLWASMSGGAVWVNSQTLNMTDVNVTTADIMASGIIPAFSILQTCVTGDVMPIPALAIMPAKVNSSTAANNSCGMDHTPGIRAVGQVLPGFLPVANMGVVNQDAWSTMYIPAQYQGLPASSAAECNCRCAQVPSGTCVGYTWMGADAKLCFLLSFAAWLSQPVGQFVDPFNNNAIAVPADSVTGRLVNGNSTTFSQCSVLYFLPDQTLVNASSSHITINVTDVMPAGASSCNQLCGQDPSCVAYSWSGPAPFAAASCSLYSDVSPGIAPDTNPGALVFASYLQICDEARLPSLLPPPPVMKNSTTTANSTMTSPAVTIPTITDGSDSTTPASTLPDSPYYSV